MPEEFDYEHDLEIDQFNLDREWVQQPNLFMKYSQAAAEADAEVKQLHEKLKVLRSELILESRTEGGAKNANEQEAYYRTKPAFKKLKQKLIESEHEAQILQSTVFAFQQRKQALENLVKLHGQQYFSDPVGEDMSADRMVSRKHRSRKKKVRRKTES